MQLQSYFPPPFFSFFSETKQSEIRELKSQNLNCSNSELNSKTTPVKWIKAYNTIPKYLNFTKPLLELNPTKDNCN